MGLDLPLKQLILSIPQHKRLMLMVLILSYSAATLLLTWLLFNVTFSNLKCLSNSHHHGGFAAGMKASDVVLPSIHRLWIGPYKHTHHASSKWDHKYSCTDALSAMATILATPAKVALLGSDGGVSSKTANMLAYAAGSALCSNSS